jgi:hypothetical protein
MVLLHIQDLLNRLSARLRNVHEYKLFGVRCATRTASRLRPNSDPGGKERRGTKPGITEREKTPPERRASTSSFPKGAQLESCLEAIPARASPHLRNFPPTPGIWKSVFPKGKTFIFLQIVHYFF